MQKEVRQMKIAEIINQYPVATQGELADRLREAGINAAQGTISRDIREMQIIKQTEANGRSRFVVYQPASSQNLTSFEKTVNETVTGVEVLQFLVLIHTLTGYASVLAGIIDGVQFPGVSATIAGEDTLVVFCQNRDRAVDFHQQVLAYGNPDLIA